MIKEYKTLRQARKSLAIQTFLLIITILTVVIIFRLKTGNRFDTSLLIFSAEAGLETADVSLEWGQDALQVTDYSVAVETDGIDSETVIYLSLLPDKPGKYDLLVRDAEGNNLAEDTFHVTRLLTVFSEKTGNFTGDTGLFFATGLFYLGLSVMMLIFFLRLKNCLIYSYEAIFSLGVMIFAAVLLIIEAPILFKHIRIPGMYQTWMLLDDIASGGKLFVAITFPLVMVFSILLIISNIALLRYEPPRIQNILGLLLGFLMIGGGLFYMHGGIQIVFVFAYFRYMLMIENIFGIVLSYIECILLSSVINGLRAAKHVPKGDLDYILILGCGFNQDGTLPPLLKGRADRAIEFWTRQKEKTGKKAILIPSGGQGASEPMAEAEAMYRYLISRGIPDAFVKKENKSVNTFQNMAFSKKIIEKSITDASKANIAFVTTNYHVFRSGIWAGLAELRAEGIGSRTKWWFWPNAFVRECVALLKKRWVDEIVFLIVLVVASGVFTWLSLL